MINSGIINVFIGRVGMMSKELDGNRIPLFQCIFIIPLLLFLSSPKNGPVSQMGHNDLTFSVFLSHSCDQKMSKTVVDVQ